MLGTILSVWNKTLQNTRGSHMPAKHVIVALQLWSSFKGKRDEKVTRTKTGKKEVEGNHRGYRDRCLRQFNGTKWIVINKKQLLPALLVESDDCQFVPLGRCCSRILVCLCGNSSGFAQGTLRCPFCLLFLAVILVFTAFESLQVLSKF